MTIEPLVVTEGARRTMLAAAEAALPEECCGVVLGVASVVEALPLPNVADDRVRQFVISPRALLLATRAARRRSLDIIGFFHSHPRGPLAPSGADINASLHWPGYHQFLVARGPTGWILKGFQVAGESWIERKTEGS